MAEESIVQSCYDTFEKCVEMLQSDERRARDFFNTSIYPKYARAVSDDSNPLRPFFFFFQQLDEYLNNPGYRALGQGSVDDIVGSFRSNFQDDYRDALEKERSARFR